MGWDNQIRGLQTIDQVHVLARDKRRGRDGMIRWEVFKQLTRFTYFLETDKEDGWSDERSSNNWSSSRTRWRQMRRGWDGMTRWEVFKQLTKFTYLLETDEEDGMGWSDEVFKQLTKFTYELKTDKEDGMRWSDKRSSNNWPGSRTPWRRTKGMGWEILSQQVK